MSGYAQGGNEDFESTQIADFLNNYYLNWHIKNRRSPDASEDEIMDDMGVLIHERFDQMSGTEALYGASGSYSGERWNLCMEIDGESPIDMTVTELINYYNDNMLDAYTNRENAFDGQDDTYENETDDEVNDEETNAVAKEFNLERVNDKNYINGTDVGCFDIDFFVENGTVLFSLYRDGTVLARKAEATIVDEGTLHFEGYDDWNIDFVWNEEASFWVIGTGTEIADMIGTEFFVTSEYAP